MDLFLERQVHDLVETAKQQLASGSHDAALATYGTALDAIDRSLALDPSNETAVLLRRQLVEDIAQATPASCAGPEPKESGLRSKRLEPPSFELLKEGDLSSEDLFGLDRGGYLPPPETLSILDTTPHPEKPEYWRVAVAVMIVAQLAVAVRVISYYSTHHEQVRAVTPQDLARYSPLPAAAPASSSAEPVDDTIYWAEPGVALPLLQSKPEPLQASSGGSVVLRAIIDPTGKPADMQVKQGSDPELNVLAMRVAEKWRFRPGTKDGKPVPVRAQLRVDFRP